MYYLELQKRLKTKKDREIFLSMYGSQKKKGLPFVLWGLFLGGFGMHHFYLGQHIIGVCFLISWFFLPIIPCSIALIEVIFTKLIIADINEKIADKIFNEINR